MKRKEWIQINDMKLRHKLLLITLLVIILISMVSIVGFKAVLNQSNEILYDQTGISMSVVSDKVSARMNNITEASLFVAVNQDFQNSLSVLLDPTVSTLTKGNARSDIYRLFSGIQQRDILSVSVISDEFLPVVFGRNTSLESTVVTEEALELASRLSGAPGWLSSSHADQSMLSVRLIRNAKQPFLGQMGYLVIRVDFDQIVRESVAEVIKTGDEYNVVIFQDDELLYTQQVSDISETLDNTFEANHTLTNWNEKLNFVIRSPIRSRSIDWDLYFGIPYMNVFNSLVFANAIFFFSIIITASFSLFVSAKLSTKISQNVQLLTAKMSQVRKGNLNPYPSPNVGKDELGTLNRYFDEMTSDFNRVMKDNYEKEKLLSQTQLRALEQQLNPHFLYNALESINWFARRGEGGQVSLIAQSLGSLLRITLAEDGDCISVERELHILESYLGIQRIRFVDRLKIEKEIDRRCMKLLIPKMSIQPLVENAIVHALEENIEECTVSVSVKLEQNMIHVEVSNNGSEIDEDILSKLQKRVVLTKGHGIGLINIDSRIRILYGSKYGLKLENKDERVIVSFRIPAKTQLSRDLYEFDTDQRKSG